MIDWVQDVLDFHRNVGCPIGDRPGLPSSQMCSDRLRLALDEWNELCTAGNNLGEFADATVDLIYVLIGSAVVYGIDLRPVWSAVHTANMQKSAIDSEGKAVKPDHWKHPDVQGIVAQQDRNLNDRRKEGKMPTCPPGYEVRKCEQCDKTKPCAWIEDPYISEICPGEKNPPAWWCDDCHQEACDII